jgi:mono/diheme cytochrome c family protein
MQSNNEIQRGKKQRSVIALLSMMLLSVAPDLTAQEQEVAAAGKVEFQRYCAVCHGPGGKGGSIMQHQNLLTIAPADLTRLSKNNKNEFPFWRVYDVVDGRVEVRGHGTREMPIWGYAFQQEEPKNLAAETKAVGRILSLVFYLQSIQAK